MCLLRGGLFLVTNLIYCIPSLLKMRPTITPLFQHYDSFIAIVLSSAGSPSMSYVRRFHAFPGVLRVDLFLSLDTDAVWLVAVELLSLFCISTLTIGGYLIWYTLKCDASRNTNFPSLLRFASILHPLILITWNVSGIYSLSHLSLTRTSSPKQNSFDFFFIFSTNSLKFFSLLLFVN